jgi:hypothetical protein
VWEFEIRQKRGKEKGVKKEYWDLSELIENLATVKTQTIPAKKEEKEKKTRQKESCDWIRLE